MKNLPIGMKSNTNSNAKPCTSSGEVCKTSARAVIHLQMINFYANPLIEKSRIYYIIKIPAQREGYQLRLIPCYPLSYRL